MVLHYLKDRLKSILMGIVFIVVFLCVFYLHAVPIEPIFYALALSSLILVFFITYDYIIYKKSHSDLEYIKNGLDNLLDKIPPANGLIEMDYQSLLRELDYMYRTLISKYDTSKTEMIDFYTMWVHQIKTPISAMSLLLQQEETKENAKLLQELFKIERYVELVLGYLRIDNMSSDLQLGEYSLSSIVNSAVKKYAPIFIYKKILLNIEDIDTTVVTDEKWLTFVVEQLISNALKYSNDKGEIKIYLQNDKTIVIEDTGIGISSEDLPRVFERGFTGYNGRMDKKSTGLGLYLCKRITDKLHHKLKIESTGKGTKVLLNVASKDIVLE